MIQAIIVRMIFAIVPTRLFLYEVLKRFGHENMFKSVQDEKKRIFFCTNYVNSTFDVDGLASK